MKTVLITGASSGIGLATAQVFAQHSYNIVITGRRQERLQMIAQDLEESFGIQVKTLCFDVQNQIEVIEALQKLQDEWQTIDVLINNAGLALGLETIDEANTDDWEVMIDTNIKGLLYMSHHVSRRMIAQNTQGHIINVGSVAGKEVYRAGNVYSATKHAVEALTKSMRIDLLDANIKVSLVSPGMVESEFSLVRFKGDDQRARNVYKGLEALTPEDVADAIYYIASRPAHVVVADVFLLPKNQASASIIKRD